MEGKLFRYEQVAAKVEESISLQKLQPGDKLPSVRQVSQELNVSLNTVFQAYSILEAKGLIFSKPKSGYIVNLPKSTPQQAKAKQEIFLPVSVEVTGMATAMMKNAKENGIINFSILAPVNEMLPISKLNKYVSAALNETRNENYQYPLVDGHPGLLKQISRRTFDWQKSIDQANILITNGCMEAINICLDAITKSGDVIAVESPTYHGILQSLEQRGLKALEIEIDPQTGLNLDDLQMALDKNTVAACIFMPSCNNPSGACMPEANKMRLVELLGKRNIPLIEDDALGELCYQPGNYPAKAYDKYNNVLYCSSFSKTLAPGFRIGWLSAGKYHKEVEKIKFGSNISTNGVLQAAIAKYLESGQYEKHLRKMRLALQVQMLKYIQAITKHFPNGVKISVPQGGISIWVELLHTTDAFALQKEVLNKGIGLCPGHIFSTTTYFHHFIRINFCPAWNFKIENALKAVAKVLKQKN
ncbi:DNA-binding transcriptional regulator, MocR family, contains an aminotransferase domain [Filimonas lacunae]|uniref:DNA-binding transcriptional regulator, MocR family, contains an aminotransferase domain n=1 Tax=Filimonas lacunae TaxID=477680 RepID=A0A173MFE2_9BACT|nr:PLP-dependent aminotransferase family protein [Filimonas lacunae]BAV06295.1 transcriptional regulator, GntR family domain [Filimonas lacunae]SIT25695.1 DNA-binding transcriptional regulator, MocR family, contains an aminotransferase domain [Filimonas lacunae]